MDLPKSNSVSANMSRSDSMHLSASQEFDHDCESMSSPWYDRLPHRSIGQQKVTALMEAIKQIQAARKYLQMNSVEVKASIHSGVSRQMEAMRSREVWLFNQADVVYQAKEEVLRAQEDRLNQALGALTNCLALIESGAAVEEDLLDMVNRVSELETHPLESPHLTFRADSAGLRDAIHRYGRVDAKGLPVSVFRSVCEPRGLSAGSDAVSLPRQFEDYEDEEHQILYKTIESRRSGEKDCSEITITIPQLPPISTLSQLTAVDATVRRSSSSVRPPANGKASSAGPGGITSTRTPPVFDGSARLDTKVRGGSAGMRSCKLTSYLDEADGQSASSSRSSIRQWLNELNVEENEEDGLVPATDITIAELTCSADKSGAIYSDSSKSPVINQDDKVLGAEMSREEDGKDRKMEFEFIRKILARPLTDWLLNTADSTKTILQSNNQPADTTLTYGPFLRAARSHYTTWLLKTAPQESFNFSCTSLLARPEQNDRVPPLPHPSPPPPPPPYADSVERRWYELIKPESPVQVSFSPSCCSPIEDYFRRIYTYPSSYWLASTGNRPIGTVGSSQQVSMSLAWPQPSSVQFLFKGQSSSTAVTDPAPAKFIFTSYGDSTTAAHDSPMDEDVEEDGTSYVGIGACDHRRLGYEGSAALHGFLAEYMRRISAMPNSTWLLSSDVYKYDDQIHPPSQDTSPVTNVAVDCHNDGESLENIGVQVYFSFLEHIQAQPTEYWLLAGGCSNESSGCSGVSMSVCHDVSEDTFVVLSTNESI